MKQTKKAALALCLVVMMLFSMGTAVFAAEQLAMPTNLEWHPAGDEILYGNMAWNLVENCEGTYEVTLYKDGVQHAYTTWHDVYDWNGTGRFVAHHPDWFDGSGNYYFTVKAYDESGVFLDSEVAVSDVWKYTAPNVWLDTPSDLTWKDNVPYWTGDSVTNYYMVIYYKDGEECGRTWGRADYDDTLHMYYEDGDYLLDVVNWNGAGEYTFSVMAISKDLTTWRNSEESVQSPVNDIAETAEDVATQTDNLVNSLYDGASAMEVREELVYTVDSDELALSMVSTSEVLDNISIVEDAYQNEMNISVEVDVNEEVQREGVPSDISIVGAALNAERENSYVSLNVRKPDREYVVDPMAYKNTVFVDMNLTNVELNTDGSLKVPVHITMPVPENITVPHHFLILHYRYSSDAYEVIHPEFQQDEDGTWYASFALTHFSPFAFVEKVVEGEEPEISEPDVPEGAVAMYRLYSPISGEHFYTSSAEERDLLVPAGWIYEGLAWYAPENGAPVYRLYSPVSGDHHYTVSMAEVETLESVGWIYEGIAWYTPEKGQPVYRLYSPYLTRGSHHYTISEDERDMLTEAGWIYEGIGWYAL